MTTRDDFVPGPGPGPDQKAIHERIARIGTVAEFLGWMDVVNFALAWQLDDGTIGIAEVKRNTDGNEALPVRHGQRQVLDYGRWMKGRCFRPKLFLVLERKPQDATHRRPLSSAHDVTLTGAPFFAGIREQ